jgi:polar amino acid transport system permease protein
MSYRFDFGILTRNIPRFLEGLLLTLEISALAALLAIVLGVVVALLRLSPRRWLAGLAAAYIEFLRNTPLLTQLYLVFFALPFVGLFLSPLASGVVALSVHHTAYFAEVYRAGIESISRRQHDAGKALGFTRWGVMRHIILPQAIVQVLPPGINQLILLVKDSSLVAAIGIVELTLTGRILITSTAATYEVFFAIGLIYLALVTALSALAKAVEWRVRYEF